MHDYIERVKKRIDMKKIKIELCRLCLSMSGGEEMKFYIYLEIQENFLLPVKCIT